MGDPRIDRIAARQAAQTAATRLTVTPLMADTAKMSDEQVGKLTALFDVFDPDGHAYSVGDVASYDGVLYRVVQAHRSQADWTPDKTPALWTPVRETKDGSSVMCQPAAGMLAPSAPVAHSSSG